MYTCDSYNIINITYILREFLNLYVRLVATGFVWRQNYNFRGESQKSIWCCWNIEHLFGRQTICNWKCSTDTGWSVTLGFYGQHFCKNNNFHLFSSEFVFEIQFFQIECVIILQELGADLSKFTNVISWYERCQKMPENNDNLAGAKDFANKVNSLLTEKLWILHG